MQEHLSYEKLSRRALNCMYTAGVIAGVIVIAVIGAVDYFWIFPDDIVVGKWVSLILAVLTLIDILFSISDITDIVTALMKNVLTLLRDICS